MTNIIPDFYTVGPRRIFTPRPVHRKVNSVHTVKFGRVGQQAWLQVDNLENVTGTSPGMMTDLNTHSIVYIGVCQHKVGLYL